MTRGMLSITYMSFDAIVQYVNDNNGATLCDIRDYQLYVYNIHKDIMCKYMQVVLAIVHQGFENNYTLSDGHESITSHNLIVFVVAVVCTTTFYY